MGLTFSDQRHPGSKVNRPAVTSSMRTVSTLPLSKVLVSSGESTFFAFKVSDSAMVPYAPLCSRHDCSILPHGDDRIPQMSYLLQVFWRTSQNAVTPTLSESDFCEVGDLMARSLAKAARFRISLGM